MSDYLYDEYLCTRPRCSAHGNWDECDECETEWRQRMADADEFIWWVSTQPEGGFTYDRDDRDGQH